MKKVTLQDVSDIKHKQLRCLCCGKVIEPLEIRDQNDLCDCKKIDASDDCYYNATGGLLNIGYGSSFDTNSYLFFLCDLCIQEKEELGRLINLKTI
jgi:hypothetical protein